MRAFVQHRQIIGLHAELSARFDELEAKHESHELKFEVVLNSIRELMEPEATKLKRPLGFRIEAVVVARKRFPPHLLLPHLR